MQNENKSPVPKKDKNNRIVRWVGGGALAFTLAFGGGYILNTNNVTHAQTAQATTSGTPGTTVTPSTGSTGQNDRSAQNQFGQKGRHGGHGPDQDGGKQGDKNHGHGSISTVSSDNLTITRPDNSTQKVVLSSSTTYSDLGKTIAAGDLKNGMKVDVEGTLNSDGSLQATTVRVEHDRLGGTVTAINGNSITVQENGKGPHGGGRGMHNPTGTGTGSTTPSIGTTGTTTTRTIVVNSNTIYHAGGQASQLSNIAIGSQINAEGTLSTDGTSLDAQQVSIKLPQYHGQVTAVNGSTITLQDGNTTRTVEVNSNTKYLNGTATASLNDIKTGVNLEAEGTVDSSGKLTASLLQLGRMRGGHGH